MDSLAVLKALGDETRYAMYRQLVAAPSPLSTHELAERLGLHANTVRLHLERLRQAELVEVESVHRGTVGRPQHLYSVAPGAPTLGLSPPATAMLVELFAALAERVGASPGDAEAIGCEWGLEAAGDDNADDVTRLCREMDRLGFEPDAEHDGTRTSVAFLRCPFREQADMHPDLVCSLHLGICEGLVGRTGGKIESFSTLYDGERCLATLAPEAP